MRERLQRRVRLLPAALLPLLALAACSDGGDSSQVGQSTRTQERRVTGPVDGSAPVTPARAKLHYGEAATIVYESPPPGRERTKVELRVRATRGSLADLKGFLRRNVRGHTPYYVEVEFANRGPGPASPSSLGSHLELLDRSGKTESRAITSLGTYPGKCQVGGPLRPWRPGQTYRDCRIFFVPDGTSPTRVTFPRVLDYVASTRERRLSWMGAR
jgi:hypothetical protein